MKTRHAVIFIGLILLALLPLGKLLLNSEGAPHAKHLIANNSNWDHVGEDDDASGLLHVEDHLPTLGTVEHISPAIVTSPAYYTTLPLSCTTNTGLLSPNLPIKIPRHLRLRVMLI
jgi:hypothetical protein